MQFQAANSNAGLAYPSIQTLGFQSALFQIARADSSPPTYGIFPDPSSLTTFELTRRRVQTTSGLVSQ